VTFSIFTSFAAEERRIHLAEQQFLMLDAVSAVGWTRRSSRRVTRARGNPPISDPTDGFDNSGIERCFPLPLDPPVKPAGDEKGMDPPVEPAGDEKGDCGPGG